MNRNEQMGYTTQGRAAAPALLRSLLLLAP